MCLCTYLCPPHRQQTNQSCRKQDNKPGHPDRPPWVASWKSSCFGWPSYLQAVHHGIISGRYARACGPLTAVPGLANHLQTESSTPSMLCALQGTGSDNFQLQKSAVQHALHVRAGRSTRAAVGLLPAAQQPCVPLQQRQAAPCAPDSCRPQPSHGPMRPLCSCRRFRP